MTPRSYAALPLDLPLASEDGVTKPLRTWLGSGPSIVVLADYTCETLCGPVISIVSDALARSELRPGADFRLVVVGLDPKDTAADADRMKNAQVGPESSIFAASYFLRGTPTAIDALTTALGFRSIYDRDHDQFAHPAAAFVVAGSGRVTRALSGLAVDPATIRLAIIDAGNGTAGRWTDHIRLLCYGYDPASGTYSIAIGRILSVASGIMVALLALLIGLLLRRQRVALPIQASGHRFEAQSRTPSTD